MIINYDISEKKTFFYYKTEIPEELHGQGEVKYLNLKIPEGKVFFDYEVKNINNDLMALMSLIIFYPFIKNNITFEFTVSQFFIKNLKKIDKFKNTEIKSLSEKKLRHKHTGKNYLITVGGGMDSASIMCLFKDAFLYHQKGKEKVDIKLLCKKLKMEKKPHIVDTNIKDFLKEKYFTHWISVFVGSILICMDNNIGYIFLGTPLENKIFKNNTYNFQINNSKYDIHQFLKDLGILFVYPLIGCSEILSSKIVYDNNADDYIIYCDKGKNNSSCHNCYKCLRKNLELCYHGKKYSKNYFKNYENAYKLIEKSNTYNFLNIFIFKNKNYYANKSPELYNFRKKYLYNTDWSNKIYSPLYLENDENIYETIFNKLKKYARPMNHKQEKKFLKYDGNKLNQTNKDFIETFKVKTSNTYYDVLYLVTIIVLLFVVKYLM